MKKVGSGCRLLSSCSGQRRPSTRAYSYGNDVLERFAFLLWWCPVLGSRCVLMRSAARTGPEGNRRERSSDSDQKITSSYFKSIFWALKNSRLLQRQAQWGVHARGRRLSCYLTFGGGLRRPLWQFLAGLLRGARSNKTFSTSTRRQYLIEDSYPGTKSIPDQ